MAPKTASKAPAASPATAPVAAPTAGSTPAQTPQASTGEGATGDSTASEGITLTSGEGQVGNLPTSEATGLDTAHASTGSGAILGGAVSNSVFPDVPENDRSEGGSDQEKPVELPYQVCSVPIRHDGEYYPVGSTVHLNFADALRLGRLVILTAGASDED